MSNFGGDTASQVLTFIGVLIVIVVATTVGMVEILELIF